MHNYYNKKKTSITILLFLLLTIGIGYAFLTSSLSINGVTKIVGNTWDIHFENLQVSEGSVTAISPASISPNQTDITYSISLARPKDFYELTVDVKNDGTLPGKVSISSLSGISAEAEPIIDYSVTYMNDNLVQTNDILNAGAKKKIKIRIFYKDDISTSDLPSTNISLSIVYSLQYLQSDVEEPTAGNLLQNLAKNNTCITKYNGQVTDRVGVTEEATNVFIDKCENKRNIIFGGYCWQVIRTTETGGLKMIYNGEPVNNKCTSTRGDHKGFIGYTNYDTYSTFNYTYLYGSSFSYDFVNNTYTLLNTETATWGASTYENLIGKYTCRTTSDTCTTMYNVGGYRSNTSAYVSSFTIDNTHYSQIGTSPFNSAQYSPASVGYMFNTLYDSFYRRPSTSEYKYGSTFTYDTGTNTYTLSGTTQNINDWKSGYNQINNTHYTCWNTTGTCSTIFYIFYTNDLDASYIKINEGKSINDVLNDMLSADNVNRNDSTIKEIVDIWYKYNFNNYTEYLEDTVFCNARNIISYGGWNPNGGSTTSNSYLGFKNKVQTTDLSCQNDTDQFSISNNKAKLKYPVALIENEEMNNIGLSSLRKTNNYYWEMSPYDFLDDYAIVSHVSSNGDLNTSAALASGAKGVRPVISLASWNVISRGSGTEADPWIVD